LQVTHDTMKQALTCRTSCLLTTESQRYYWYKDGQYLMEHKDTSDTFPLTKDSKGNYYCSVHGYNEILSRPL
ncbi:sialoadhesin-like isoform X2, partial [Clarias magur]